MTIPTRDPFGARLRATDRSLINAFSLLKLSSDTPKEESIRKMMSPVKSGGGPGCVSAKQINKGCNTARNLAKTSTPEVEIEYYFGQIDSIDNREFLRHVFNIPYPSKRTVCAGAMGDIPLHDVLL